MQTEINDDIYSQATICRAFEDSVYHHVKRGTIKVPVYLSAGQELISSTISCVCTRRGIEPFIFAQHRAHSIYLSFGGPIVPLMDELLGSPNGCAGGKGGSASIHCPRVKMFGHDGLMGSNVPIGVGACFASGLPTIVFVGDAAGEEDYALAAYGWAVTKNLPILFVVEDNNLSILTEKKVRRSWELHNVAKGFGMEAYNIDDDPKSIINTSSNWFEKPVLLNINTTRLYWHAGAGKDGNPFDRLAKSLDTKYYQDTLYWINNKWEERLKITSNICQNAISQVDSRYTANV